MTLKELKDKAPEDFNPAGVRIDVEGQPHKRRGDRTPVDVEPGDLAATLAKLGVKVDDELNVYADTPRGIFKVALV